MAGLPVLDFFTLFVKSNVNGRHCENESCKFRNKDISHYHCNLCCFARHGYAKSRMENHISSKHPNESEAAFEMLNENPQSLQLSDYPALLDSSADRTIVGNVLAAEPPCSPLEVPSVSVHRPFVIKKSRVSTPLSSHQVEAKFLSPAISPLARKSAVSLVPSIDPVSSCKTCVVADCCEKANLKPLARKKARGRGDIVDWENAKLLLTYHRLGNGENIFDMVICDSHWREWYRFNVKLNKSLNPYIENCPRTSLFTSTLAYNFYTWSGRKFLQLFDSSKCCCIIFQELNVFELKSLSVTCKTLNDKVNDYFKYHPVSWEKLLQTFMVNQSLEGLTHQETFAKIYSNLTEIRHTHIDTCDMPEIIDLLGREKGNASNVSSELRVILNCFGHTRQPTSLEILVYVTGKYLQRALKMHTSFVKNVMDGRNELTSFRVGVEAFSLPVVFNILYLTLTGQVAGLSGCAQNLKQTLFRCLAITSILQKMLDYKVVTPFHRVLSNEASLTCSKALIGVLNRSGISFSYVKDLKDCKYARQLWNSIGVKYSMQNTSSNIHWIECDNLETMLKTTSIHNAERLTHFMTSQLEYVPNLITVIDLYEKATCYDMDTQCFKIGSHENILHNNFLQGSLEKCANLKEVLTCETIVFALSHDSSHDNADIRPFNIEEDVNVSQRIISCGRLLPTSTSVYLRMEQLCSSTIQDVKKLLDMIADDYGLNSICYIPSVACMPLLFASRYLSEALIEANLRGDDILPPPYFIQWGFIPLEKSGTRISADNCVLDLNRLFINAINKLKDHRNGIFAATKLMESTIQLINEEQ